MSTIVQPRYRYPETDDIEDIEQYCPGGFHPVSIGDIFGGGRYKVVHKLGYGGSSTVWLVKGLSPPDRSQPSASLLTLKVLSAEQSSKPRTEIAELYIPQELDKLLPIFAPPGTATLQVIKDHFFEDGPNGSHLCLVSQLAGPSVLSMAECPGRVSGSRRLRGDLSKRVAKQVTTSVALLHSAGIVHADITTSNILFQLSNKVHKWSVDDIYQILGRPEMEEVSTCDGSPPGPSAPSQIVAPINISRLSSPSLLLEDIVLIDFGQSFFTSRPPPHCAPAAPLHYRSPEAFFESKVSLASDVWALACTIFEIRSGSPLFDPFFRSDILILKQIVETLGPLPEPWWSSWEARRPWFNEAGAPRPEDEQRGNGVQLLAVRSSLRQKLCDIGKQDDAHGVDEGSMIEKTGTQLGGSEVELLADLLEKMLRYRPEERITMSEVMRHPWFG